MNIRPGKYATFGALINDTRDNLFDPKLLPNDAYVIELDGGTDVDGNEIHADDTVIFDGKDWRLVKTIDEVPGPIDTDTAEETTN